MTFFWGFLIGGAVGAVLGLLMAGLCRCAAKGDALR